MNGCWCKPLVCGTVLLPAGYFLGSVGFFRPVCNPGEPYSYPNPQPTRSCLLCCRGCALRRELRRYKTRWGGNEYQVTTVLSLSVLSSVASGALGRSVLGVAFQFLPIVSFESIGEEEKSDPGVPLVSFWQLLSWDTR